jgi:hypothetical protein
MSASVKVAWQRGSSTIRRLRPSLGRRGSAATSRCQGEFDVEENGEEGAAERAPAARGQAAAMAPATEGKMSLGPYHCENEGNSGRTGWQRSRRSRRQMKSKNGGVVAVLNAGWWSDGVWRCELPLGFSKLEGSEEKMEWRRGWRPGRGVMARRARLRGPPSHTRTPSTASGGHAAAELCSRSGTRGARPSWRLEQASFAKWAEKGAVARFGK